MVPRRVGLVPLMPNFGPEHPADWLTKDRLETLPDTVFFHARNKLSESLQAGNFQLMTALADHVLAAGWQVNLINFAPDAQDRASANPRHLHIFMDDRPIYARNVIHAVPSYLKGFWYFDEIGSRNNSLMRMAKFDQRAINADFAAQFHARMYNRFATQNRSKFDQEPRGSLSIRPDCLAFFAQDFKPPKNHRHFITVPQMIEAAIAAKGHRYLYIKPHPNQGFDEVEALSRYHAPEAGVEVTHASIHDLLDAADCALTLTSAVGFEAFLHKTPVILGGQADFWQNAITLTNPARMAAAIDAAMTTKWQHEKFLLWYLRQNCLDDNPQSLPRVLEKLHRKGFAFADPGQGFF